MISKNLKTTRPLGKTLIFSLAIILFIISAAEIVFRLPMVQSKLPSPSLGLNHRFLDLKIAKLKSLIHEEGPVDCFFIGASQLARGINPEDFNETFAETTGKNILSFNIGSAGLTLNSIEKLMKIIIKLYQPKMIVVGVFPGHMQEEIIRPSEERILENPWIRYQTGDNNFEGWMTDKAISYRYFLRLRQWLEHPEYSASISRKESSMSPYGFTNFRKNPRGLYLDPKRVKRFKNLFKDFEISSQRLLDFENIMKYRSEAALAIIEMPTHPIFKSFYRRKEKDHFETLDLMKELSASQNVFFLQADNPEFDSDRLWKQSNHMNSIGAKIFSLWLGRKIGEAVKTEAVPFPIEQ